MLGVTAAAATFFLFIKKMFGAGMNTLVISNAVMNGIMKRVKSLEESDVSETIKNEAK